MRSSRLGTFVTLGASLAILIGLLGAPAQAGTKASKTDVSGEFVQAAGMVTSYDIATGTFSGVGIATVNGDWIGYWYEDIKFTIDPSTGDAVGTSLQTFNGTTADGTSGTLTVAETFTISGDTHQSHGEGKIIGGTGDWTGSSGYYWADGFNAADGFGWWHARWIRSAADGR
jgi:hypothetical protein